jgi:hypothetical protein
MSKVDPRPKLELSLLPPFHEDFHKNENMPFSNLNVGSWVKRDSSKPLVPKGSSCSEIWSQI